MQTILFIHLNIALKTSLPIRNKHTELLIPKWKPIKMYKYFSMHCCCNQFVWGRNSYAYELFRCSLSAGGIIFSLFVANSNVNGCNCSYSNNKSCKQIEVVICTRRKYDTRNTRDSSDPPIQMECFRLVYYCFFFSLSWESPCGMETTTLTTTRNTLTHQYNFFSLIIFNFAWPTLTAEYFTHCCR